MSSVVYNPRLTAGLQGRVCGVANVIHFMVCILLRVMISQMVPSTQK
jgi:hypothetical protein